PMPDPLAKVRREPIRLEQPLEQQARMEAGRHDPRAHGTERSIDLAAVLPRIDTPRFAIAENFDATSLSRLLERRRDRAHAADRVSPCAFDAVHLAERMVEQQITRARVVRAREVPDDRIEAEPAFQRIDVEPTVEPVAGAAGEQVPQRLDAGRPER